MDYLDVNYVEHEDYNEDEANQIIVCQICGWWKAIRMIQDIEPAIIGMPNSEDIFDDGIYRYTATYGAIGSLVELDLININQPIEDVRNYLMAKYESRFVLHPGLFEETVSGVCTDLGYKARVTGYSGDGRIDIILDGDDEQLVGIQVKRYKNSIEAEQIRSLAGALFIGGYTKGIFVATSRFQSGAEGVSNAAALRGMPIE